MKVSPPTSSRFPMSSGAKSKGFSLVELVVCVAVLGILVAMIMPSFAGIIESTRSVKTKQQVQAIAQTYAAARTAGAVFANPTLETVLNALTSPTGVQGRGIFSKMTFRLTITEEEKAALLISPGLAAVKLPDGSLALESHPELIF